MRALVFREIGNFPTVEKTILDTPEVGWVEVDLIASALNRRDFWITQGMYPGIRTPIILGSDGVGHLDGKKVLINPGWKWGSNMAFQSTSFEVLGLPSNGTFAEKVHVPKEYVHPMPDHLSWEEAAALPLAGVTAFRALVTKGQVKPRQKVVITGIGGGVATMALLFAKSYEAEVYVTSSSKAKREKATQLGAAGAVDYKDPNWIAQLNEMTGGIDLVIDGAGGEGISQLLSICNYGARIVMYGGTVGKIPNLSPQKLFWKQIQLLGSTMGSPQDFDRMLDQVVLGDLRPAVDSVFSFDESPQAFQRLKDGEQYGKIVFQNTVGRE